MSSIPTWDISLSKMTTINKIKPNEDLRKTVKKQLGEIVDLGLNKCKFEKERSLS